MQLTPASHHRIIFLSIIQLKLRCFLMLPFCMNNFLLCHMAELCDLVHVLTIHDLKPHFLLLFKRRGGVYDVKGFSGNAILSFGGFDAAEELVLLVFRLLKDESTVQSATFSWWLFGDSRGERRKRLIEFPIFELSNPLLQLLVFFLIDKHLQILKHSSIPLLPILILLPKSNNLLLHVLKNISVDLHGL